VAAGYPHHCEIFNDSSAFPDQTTALFLAGHIMLMLCFCLDGNPPLLCHSAYRPQIGDTISLSEFDRNLGPLRVTNVVGDGFDNRGVRIRVRQVRTETTT
jgi:hypothetical protein